MRLAVGYRLFLPILSFVFFFMSSCSGDEITNEFAFDFDKAGGIRFTLQIDPRSFVLEAPQRPSNKFSDIILQMKYEGNGNAKDYFSAVVDECNSNGFNPIRHFSSGNPEEYGEVKNDKQLVDALLKSYDTEMKASVNALIVRFGNMQISNNVYLNEEGELICEFESNVDKEEIMKEFKKESGFEFYETYDGYEMWELLLKLEEDLRVASDDSIGLTEIEIDSTADVDLFELQDEADTEPQYEEEAVLTAEEQKAIYPIMSMISPSVYTDSYGMMSYTEGAVLGYVLPQDTAEVNDILSSPKAKAILPYNVRVCYGTYKDANGQDVEQLQLYMLKELPKKDNISSSDIENVEVIQDHYGEYVVDIRFNQIGSKKWEDITERNVDRAIAIVVYNDVISAPLVREKMSSAASISGGFQTFDEANAIADAFQHGGLNYPLVVLKEEVVDGK